MAADLLAEIEQRYPDFSKGQKAIADYILAHCEKAAFMTAARLGAEVGVSESTVVRFVTEFGYAGYPELKRALQQLIKNRLTSLQRMQVAEEKMRDGGVLQSVLAADMANISQTLQQTDPAEFDAAVDSLIGARNIYIIGVRSAATLASSLAFNLNLVFDNIRLVDASGAAEVFEQMIRVDSDDAVVGISFPRYSQRTVRALNFAHDRGAHVIAVTDTDSSPLVPFADTLLLARSDMAAYIDSLVAPMSLINALAVGVSMKKKSEIEQIFGRLEELWDEYQVYDRSDRGGAGQ